MGIVNVTPDSFSDGGKFTTVDLAVAHALQLVEEGADLIDIGGESTRPGAQPVSLADELQRVIPVVRALRSQIPIPISIDTTKAEVARQALDSGADVVNDISGLTFDQAMPGVCAEAGAGVVCMHIQGTPQTMQLDPHYTDVVTEIALHLEERCDALVERGIDRSRICLDPGIGFGKTAEQNVAILSHIQAFRALGYPVLIGHSRKRFLKRILNKPLEEPTFGTLGVSVALAMQNVEILRVHDIAATRDTLLAWLAIASRIAP